MGKISMESRNEIIENKKAMYQRSTKTAKTKLLNELVSTTGMSRDHVSRRLRMPKRQRKSTPLPHPRNEGEKHAMGCPINEFFFLYRKRWIIPAQSA